MSRLILVRHAQASFFATNYDQLSPLGERQAGALGEYWLRMGRGVDEVIVGPRQRQQRTEQLIRAAYDAGGMPWPEADVCPEFDEHCVARLLREPLEALQANHPSLRPLADEYRRATTPPEQQRSFQRLFEAVCHLWCTAAPGTESVESWRAFQSRIEAAVRRIVEAPRRNHTAVVFTSVGNITAALRFALNCPPATAFELGWRIRNASVTELVYSQGRVTLDGFNAVGHLTDPSTWTYR